MQLWISRKSQVSAREQLVTQVVLAILCGDLASGERLPSTRELARRFRIHPNTISAAYRQLERDRWVELRPGSGVFVRRGKPDNPLTPELALDNLIANFFRSARHLGARLPAIRSHLRQWLESQPPDHFLLIEPDEELRSIVVEEMQRAVTFPVTGCGLEGVNFTEELENAIPVALPSKARIVRQALPAGVEPLTLKVRSVPSALAAWLPAPSSALLGIASRWPEFLKLARTMLIAAGFDPDTLVFRDARKPHWQRGLSETAAVVCDSVTASNLPERCRVILFSLLSEPSISELRHLQESIRSPFGPTSL